MSEPPPNTPDIAPKTANEIPVLKLEDMSIQDKIKDNIQKAIDKLLKIVIETSN